MEIKWASQVVLLVKNPPANAGDVRHAGSIPGSGRSTGGGHGNPLHYLAWRIPWTEEPGGLQACPRLTQPDLWRQVMVIRGNWDK